MARKIIFERGNDAFSVGNIDRRRRAPNVEEHRSGRYVDVYINNTPFLVLECMRADEALLGSPRRKRRKTASGKDKQYVTCRNNFDSLPDEIILNIFQKLPQNQLGNLALVCWRFKQIVDDESLWETIDASHRVINPDVLRGIMGRPVKILRLAESRVISRKTCPETSETYPDDLCRLIHLDLTGSDISPHTLTVILNKCRNLKRLSLARILVTDDVIVALSANKDLEVLKLEWTRRINAEIMDIILTNCRKLKELNVGNTQLMPRCVRYICRNIPSSLEKFNISGCWNLQNEHVEQIVKKCPNIRELDLSFCSELTLNVVPILYALNELRTLDIRGCQIPQAPLTTLKEIKEGVYLNVHDVRQEFLADMSSYFIRSVL